MRLKLFFTITCIICLTFIFFKPLLYKKTQETIVSTKKETVKPTKTIQPEVVKLITTKNNIALLKIPFTQLPGWETANVKKSLSAFQTSCNTFLKQKPTHQVGSQHIDLQAGDWHPACAAALLVESFSETTARSFFETWFHPIEFKQKKSIHGLFTGYYMPRLNGSLTKTDQYNTPIYGLPKNMKSRFPWYTREKIDNGLLGNKAPVIAWISSPVDRLFMEIEGSGVIQLPNGKPLYLGYAGENGAPYTSIGGVLIKKGVLTRDNASKQAITHYLERHPDKIDSILHKNRSFVFFENLKKPMALGAQGTALTPGYSLAVDKKWIPLGAPLWLDTTKSHETISDDSQFQRLMIAQDTGGAIRGLMRGDVYWGSGKKANYLGEHMKNEGRFWLLLPKRALTQLMKSRPIGLTEIS